MQQSEGQLFMCHDLLLLGLPSNLVLCGFMWLQFHRAQSMWDQTQDYYAYSEDLESRLGLHISRELMVDFESCMYSLSINLAARLP